MLGRWSQYDIDLFSRLGSRTSWLEHLVRKDPFAISVADQVRLKLSELIRGAGPYPGCQRILFEVGAQHFQKSDGTPISAQVFYWRHPDHHRAPVVFYLPGIFQDSCNASTYQAVRLLLQAGNHVVFVPNPLTKEYRQREPVAAPAQFIQEAEVILAFMQSFKAAWSERIQSLHLAGASYGGFLASIVAALDAQREDTVLDGQTTILFPPLHMTSSVALLDNLISSALAPRWIMRPRHLVGLSFHQMLIDLVERIQAQYHLDRAARAGVRAYPSRVQQKLEAFDGTNRTHREAVNFKNLLHDYIGVRLEFYQRPESHLSYWLNQAYIHGNTRLRVLLTKDDWLNEQSELVRLPDWLQNNGNLLIRSHGGHAGFVAAPWFAQFVSQSMNLRSSPVDSGLRSNPGKSVG